MDCYVSGISKLCRACVTHTEKVNVMQKNELKLLGFF